MDHGPWPNRVGRFGTDSHERGTALSETTNPFLDPVIPHRLLDDPSVLFVAIDGTARVRWASNSAKAILGRVPSEVVGRDAFPLLHPDDHEIVIETMAEAARGSADRIRVVLRLLHADGRWISLEFGGVDLRDETGVGWFLAWGSPHEPTGQLLRFLDAMLAGAHRDELLAQVSAWHDGTTPGTTTGVLVRQPDGGFRCTSGSVRLPDQLRIDLDPQEARSEPWASALAGPQGVTIDLATVPHLAAVAPRAGFHALWAMPVRTAHGDEPEALLLLWRATAGPMSATQRRQLQTTAQVVRLGLEWWVNQSTLVRAATTDSLTGLANRTQLDQRIRSDRSPLAAVLFCDLDDFKQVNDRHGHLVGDRILRQAGARLAGAIGPDDLLVRLGGDEFAVWCSGLRSTDDAEALAARIVASMAEPLEVSGVPHTVGCSVGVAVVAADDPRVGDVDRILSAADQALYRAKGAGKGRWSTDPTPTDTLPFED